MTWRRCPKITEHDFAYLVPEPIGMVTAVQVAYDLLEYFLCFLLECPSTFLSSLVLSVPPSFQLHNTFKAACHVQLAVSHSQNHQCSTEMLLQLHSYCLYEHLSACGLFGHPSETTQRSGWVDIASLVALQRTTAKIKLCPFFTSGFDSSQISRSCKVRSELHHRFSA